MTINLKNTQHHHQEDEVIKYHLSHHQHGDHSHFNLEAIKDPHSHSHDHSHSHHSHSHDHHHHDGDGCQPCGDDHHHSKEIGQNEEGCPCCAAAIDLDEVVTAINEIKSNSSQNEEGNPLGEIADFSSGAHWGIFLGISGPLSLIGLTAAVRNIKGTTNNKLRINECIKGLQQDINRYKARRDRESAKNKQDLSAVIQRLEAFQSTLKYSKFDANFNLYVPGYLNGAASTAVLSTGIIASPWALPIIALYAGCQTVRNAYDVYRIWNKIIPEDVREGIELNTKVGFRKINQITSSKRKFYTANTLGFAAFTAGAVITGLSATSIIGAPGMLVGIPLLGAGAVSTGITNNIWTNKFRPRNGNLGIERQDLNLDDVATEIGKKREIKKILKNYRDKHLDPKRLKGFGCALLSSLPFLNKYGANLAHKTNQTKIAESNISDSDRLDLLERIINANKLLATTSNHKEAKTTVQKIIKLEPISEHEKTQFSLVSLNKDNLTCQNGLACQEIFKACIELEIDNIVLDRFVTNELIKSKEDHDVSIKTKEDYLVKLTKGDIFKQSEEEIIFDLKTLEQNPDLKKGFLKAFDECLLFDYLKKLEYEQYGLNDFYWSLKKQNKGAKDQTYLQTSDPNHDDHRTHNQHEGHTHNVERGGNNTHIHVQNPKEQKLQQEPKRQQSQEWRPEQQTQQHLNPEQQDQTNLGPKEDAPENLLIPIENTPEVQESLLKFQTLAHEKISQDEQERQLQIQQQNEIIDQVSQESRDFILQSEHKNHETNQTIFVYADPDHQDPNDPNYESKQVIYIRNDATGEIDVKYGQKAQAIIIEKPNQIKNGTITQIEEKGVSHYGPIHGNIFRSFEMVESAKQTPSNELQSTNYSNWREEQEKFQSP